MNVSVQAISPEQMAEEMKNGAPISQLVDVREYMIRANPTKRTVALEYERVAKGLKAVFISSYRRVNDPEARKIYEEKTAFYRDEIRNQMANISKNLSNLTKKWELQLQEAGIEPADTFTNPALLRVNITSPEEHHYWQIIQQMDWLLIVMENLWHYRGLDMEDKQNVVGKITKQIYGLGTNLEYHASKVRSLIAIIYRNQNRVVNADAEETEEEVEVENTEINLEELKSAADKSEKEIEDSNINLDKTKSSVQTEEATE